MDSSDRIKVMVVDDHDMVRTGLSAFARSFADLKMIGEASSGEQAVDMCAVEQPDVILMDVIMPGMGGIETTRVIRSRYPDIKVIALTSHKNDEAKESALNAGASGYLLKNASIDELIEAIRAAYNGTPLPEIS